MMITLLDPKQLITTELDEISNLFKQLSPNKTQINPLDILSHLNNTTQIVACTMDQKIVGIASLATYTVISGNKGWIEDVVVDQSYRQKGIGKQLIQKLIEIGEGLGLSAIYLYTEDEKVAAIQLYKKLGFRIKNSRIYTLSLPL